MTIRLLTGDCREVLRTLPDQSVNCCVTSPPYFGLRDYGTASWVGGDSACEHKIGEIRTGSGLAALGAQYRGGGVKASKPKPLNAKNVCPHCGAVRVDSQIGIENTPEKYITTLVDVFRDVRRVLREDGTLWLNIGDSYAGSWGAQGRRGGNNDGKHSYNKSVSSLNQITNAPKRAQHTGTITAAGVKPKDLYGIPWMLAFALRADGWYLRQDIIWNKPNPMPESVEDRCTKAHEYLFLLSKSPRYYYDQEAILEPSSPNTHARLAQDVQNQIGSDRVPGKTNGRMKAVGRKFDPAAGNKNNASFDAAMAIMPPERNKRSVWTVATQPFKDAHFATFPPGLVQPCIKAGCPQGGCVLDPFGGAGTTGLVADRLHRDAILIELNPDYAAMARRRICGDSPLFTEVA